MRKWLPRIYVCPDVYLICWLGYEWIIKRKPDKFAF